MTVHAAAADTWGIPGPTFLLGYLIAAALVMAVAVIARRRLFAGRSASATSRLGPQQAAYLNGGARLAVYTALGGLRAAGAIGVGGGVLAPTGPLPAGVTPLDTAVYNAAGKRVRARDVEHDPWVAGALTELRESLEAAGLAVPARARRAARLWPLALLALAALGVARIYAGMAGDRPVGYLALAVVALVVVAAVQLSRTPRAARAGQSALHLLQFSNQHLAPGRTPAYATYGAGGAAMGVALFGAASLWALDPAFAAEAEIQRQYASSGSSSGSGSTGGDSSGGGGGCGGGGCGG